MKIRTFILCWGLLLASSLALAQDKLGVVLMHGKQGGGPRDSSLDVLHKKLQEAGMVVIKPEMPLDNWLDTLRERSTTFLRSNEIFSAFKPNCSACCML